MANPIKDFQNKSRLLSDDEKTLVNVLLSFYDAIEDLRQRIAVLENGKTDTIVNITQKQSND